MNHLLRCSVMVVALLPFGASLHADEQATSAVDPKADQATRLFMDTHRNVKGITPDGIAKGHQRDLAVQGKYGAKFVQYWYDQKTGTVFCLCEAANEEACQATHREAHGEPADEITQVSAGQ